MQPTCSKQTQFLKIAMILINTIIFLSGCGSTQEEIAIEIEKRIEATLTANPLPTKNVIEITVIVSSTYTPTKTKTPTPTKTLTPTITLTPTNTFTPVYTATPTPILHLREKDQMEMVFVPEGSFVMGNDESTHPESMRYQPENEIYLSGFWIDRYEVSSGQFMAFLDEKCQTNPEWLSILQDCMDRYYVNYYVAFSIYRIKTYNLDNTDIHIYEQKSSDIPTYSPRTWYFSIKDDYRIDYPMNSATWTGADAYCKWVGAKLPSEAQWEKAARGIDSRKYPWGNDINFWKFVTPYRNRNSVFSNIEGVSPYGALNMSGNVMEWVLDWYFEDYYQNISKINPLQTIRYSDQHSARGGGLKEDLFHYTTFFRFDNVKTAGFRCASSYAP